MRSEKFVGLLEKKHPVSPQALPDWRPLSLADQENKEACGLRVAGSHLSTTSQPWDGTDTREKRAQTEKLSWVLEDTELTNQINLELYLPLNF